ncbi:MAG: hypothetical protein MUF84_17405, partial [Anaerolineae bacterium]|nr:hypothetical protein [Anaerolineae bacterium]
MLDISLDSDGEALVERHRRWWRREETLVTRVEGEPLGTLWLPLVDGTEAADDTLLTPDMIDVERLVGARRNPGPIGIVGDTFAVAQPFTRVPWLEAILGNPVEALIQGGSMRTHRFVEGWEDWHGVSAHRNGGWHTLLLQITTLLVERSGGRYATVAPVLRGPSDLAEAVLGPELMAYSLFDYPDRLRRFLDEVTEVFSEVNDALLARFAPVADGTVSYFGIWAPGRVVRTQCDASAFLSAKHYRDWFLPYDLRICERVDTSIIHLHSCSMHTVDALLETPLPHAIQVILEEGPNVPTLQALVPIFRRV